MLKNKLGVFSIHWIAPPDSILCLCLFLSIFTCCFSTHTPPLRYKPGKSAGANCSPHPPKSGHYRLVLQHGPTTDDYDVYINVGNCPIRFRKEQYPELNLDLCPAPLLCCGPAHIVSLHAHALINENQSIHTCYKGIGNMYII